MGSVAAAGRPGALTGSDPETAQGPRVRRRGRLGRLGRARLWKVTAAVSTLVFCGLVAVAAQGSVTILADRPASLTASSWETWCTRGEVRTDRQRLAFCARVEGLVISTTHGPGPTEAHVAVVCDFHLVIVRLPDGMAPPSRGSRVTAVGPLLRARDGQREVQAFRMRSA